MRYILPFFTGLITGAVFSALKLPIPAPGVAEGIVGIIGIFIGFKLVSYVPIAFAWVMAAIK
jgi:XapX domain-containing protein